MQIFPYRSCYPLSEDGADKSQNRRGCASGETEDTPLSDQVSGNKAYNSGSGGMQLPVLPQTHENEISFDMWPGSKDSIRNAWNKSASQPPPVTRRLLFKNRWIGFTGFPLIFCGFIFLLIIARESVVRVLPGTAPIYDRLGYPVNLRGFRFQDLALEWHSQDGQAVLMIKGVVTNITSSAQTIPSIELTLIDEKGIKLYCWTTLASKKSLAPKEVSFFSSRLLSPPPASKLQVRFSGQRSDMAQKSKIAS